MNTFDNYRINGDTMYLAPGRNINYETKVVEVNKEIYIKSPPLSVINFSCIFNNFTTYDGIRQGMQHIFNFRKKTPAPFRCNCLFPTHAINSHECYWISAIHIKAFKPIKNSNETKILFHNGNILTVNVSTRIIQSQVSRAKKAWENYLQGEHNYEKDLSPLTN